MSDLRQAFLNAVRDGTLWEAGHHVALAVSGGVDSMVLLDLAARTAPVHGARLTVVTVDHGLHPLSASHADGVARHARDRGLEVVVHRLDLPPGTSEAAAREARYAAFGARLAGEGTHRIDRVALAHHRRDQAETVLVNLLRGTGPRGMRGMRPVRGPYVRPLLDLDADAIRAHAHAASLPVFEDPSNTSDRFLRNRVRRQLLPLLESLRAGSVNALARSATRFAEDEALLEQLASGLPVTTAALASAPAPLARRRIEQLTGNQTTARIDAILRAIRSGAGRVELGGGRAVVVAADSVVVEGDGDADRAPR